MPSEQFGQPYRTARGWGVRYYDRDGTRRRKSGFRSRSEALTYYRDVIRPQIDGLQASQPEITLQAFILKYLEAHSVGREASTIQTLRERLRHAEKTFGPLSLQELERRASEIADWRRTLPEGSRYGATQALRQTLDTAVRWGYISQNPAKLAGPNPQPKRAEIEPFTPQQIDNLAAELGQWGPMIRFAAATGLRPCEWIALQHQDINRPQAATTVQRSFTRGVAKRYGKTARSRRRVPLSNLALQALDELPRRLNTQLVFPAPGGGNNVKAGHGSHLDLHNWRAREWKPALEAAGLPQKRIYDLRHTFATDALAAGIPIFELSRYMGTSVQIIDATYGHLAHGTETTAKTKLDALDQQRLDQERAIK
ncbi:MAG: site-specific integrase [Actinomycetia bacterium]|nr:site-specific integrase [Actinomycetes bacterium]